MCELAHRKKQDEKLEQFLSPSAGEVKVVRVIGWRNGVIESTTTGERRLSEIPETAVVGDIWEAQVYGKGINLVTLVKE